MQLTTVQLWERIHASGLASPEQCRQWAKGISASAGPSALADPASLVKELVAAGHLTAYQANVLFRGLHHPVRVDDVVILRSLESELGPNWYVGRAANASSSSNESSELWVAAMASIGLAKPDVQQWPPSLSWARLHCNLGNSDHLIRWKNAGATLQHLYVVADPLMGTSLDSVLADGPMEWERTIPWVRGAAQGLQKLHQAGMVHGNLSTTANWIRPDGSSAWLTDPLFPPRSAYFGVPPSLLQGYDQRLAVAAPELIAPGAIPSALSDMYALGCLWYRCLVGEFPFDPGPNANEDVWGKLHSAVPVLIPDRVPKSIGHCLLHLLAKDPSRRFASAEGFLTALQNATSEAASMVPSRVDRTKPSPVNAPNDELPKGSIENGGDSSSTKTSDATKKSEKQRAVVAGSANRSEAGQSNKPSATPVTSDGPQKTSDSAKELLPKEPQPKEPRPKTIGPSKGTPSSASPSKSSTPMRAAVTPAQSSDVSTTSENEDAANRRSPPRPINNPLLASPTPMPGTEALAEEIEKAKLSQDDSKAPTPATLAATASSNANDQPNLNEARQSTESPIGMPSSNTKSTTPAIDLLNSLPANGFQESQSTSAATTPKPKKGKKKKRTSGVDKAVSAGSMRGKGKRKSKRPAWFMPLVIGCSLLFLLVLMFAFRSGSKGLLTIDPNRPAKKLTNPDDSKSSNTAPVTDRNKSADPLAEFFVIKGDDGKVPWAPPTAGQPHSLDMLPAGLEAVLFLSDRAWNHQGPIGTVASWWHGIEPQLFDLPEAKEVDESSIGSVAIALYPGKETGSYDRVVRFHLRSPKRIKDVVKSFDGYSAVQLKVDGAAPTIWTRQRDGQSIALAAEPFRAQTEEPITRFTMGPLPQIEMLASTEGRPGPLRRQMESLLQTTDDRADATILVAPSFLYGDGKELLGPHSARLLGILRTVVGDDVQALLIRTQLDPQWYVEWRTLGNDLQSAFRDASELKKKLDALSDKMEERFNARPADGYWRALANRYPQMLRSLSKYVRVGAEDGNVVLNAYLPPEALANLAISSWMAIQSDGNGPAAVSTVKPTAPSALTVEQLLDAKVSLRLEQESLEMVLVAIANELKDTHMGGKETLPMAINGTAFQKDGITRNQQIRGFEFKDTPVRDLLTALCRRANPVTTVKSPDEKDQKVVWLLLDDPSTPSKKKLDMTTRAWAESNSAVLPKEFVLPSKK